MKLVPLHKTNISAELRALDINGDYVWFSLVGNTIFDTKGNPISVLGQTTNINHEKQEMEILKNLSEREDWRCQDRHMSCNILFDWLDQ